MTTSEDYEDGYNAGYKAGHAEGFEVGRTLRLAEEYDNGWADARADMRRQQHECKCGLHPDDPPDEQRQHAVSALRAIIKRGDYPDLIWIGSQSTANKDQPQPVALPEDRGRQQSGDGSPSGSPAGRDLGGKPGDTRRHRADDTLRRSRRADAGDAELLGRQPNDAIRLWTPPAL